MRMAVDQKWLLCVPLLFASAALAAGQESKSFPEARCKFTLPGPDWDWLDPDLAPKGAGQPLAFAANQKGLGYLLVCSPLRKDEKPTALAFESFEAGFLEKSKVKKLAGKESTFRGIATYQFEVELPGGATASLRIMYANNSFYLMQASNSIGALTAAEADAIFRGFDFTGTPESVMIEDSARERGRAFGQAIAMMGVIGGVVFVIFYFKKRRRNTGSATGAAEPEGRAEDFKPTTKRQRGRWRSTRPGQTE